MGPWLPLGRDWPPCPNNRKGATTLYEVTDFDVNGPGKNLW